MACFASLRSNPELGRGGNQGVQDKVSNTDDVRVLTAKVQPDPTMGDNTSYFPPGIPSSRIVLHMGSDNNNLATHYVTVPTPYRSKGSRTFPLPRGIRRKRRADRSRMEGWKEKFPLRKERRREEKKSEL